MPSPISNPQSLIPDPAVSHRLLRLTPFILLVGDLLVLLGFVLAGQVEHELVEETNPALRPAMITGAFAVVWLVVGWRLGLFRREIAPLGEGVPRPPVYAVLGFLERTLIAWLAAAPLGILIRGFMLGRAVIPTLFLVVTLGLGGGLLLAWRLVFALIWLRLRKK